MVHFHRVQQGGHAAESDLNAVLSKPMASNHYNMADVQTSEVRTVSITRAIIHGPDDGSSTCL
jgi:hypothetical protein